MGVHKTVLEWYSLDAMPLLFYKHRLLLENSSQRSIFRYSVFQTCWRRTVCQNRLRTASPQRIAALAAQGGVATLTERSDANILGQAVFLLTENEAPQDARYSR